MSNDTIKPLPGWMLVTEVAERLGVSRQSVHKMIINKQLKSTRSLGQTAPPIYVIREEEVTRLLAQRQQSETNGKGK